MGPRSVSGLMSDKRPFFLFFEGFFSPTFLIVRHNGSGYFVVSVKFPSAFPCSLLIQRTFHHIEVSAMVQIWFSTAEQMVHLQNLIVAGLKTGETC